MRPLSIVKKELELLGEVGEDLKTKNPEPLFGTPEYFMLSAIYRAINLSEAIILLTAVEALAGTSEPLLRTVFELSINAEWIFTDKKKVTRRLKNYFEAPAEDGEDYWFGEKWTESSLKDRMRAVGFDVESGGHEDYYRLVILHMHDYCHNNVMSMPKPPEYTEHISSGSTLSVLAQSLQHLLLAADLAFEGVYPQHKEALILVKTIRSTKLEDMEKIDQK